MLPTSRPPSVLAKEDQHVLLIINPVSGKAKAKSSLHEILDALYRAEDGTPSLSRLVTVCPTMYRGHAAALAASAHARGFDRVICCGGDGTLNETINGLMSIPANDRPTLGYIPAGSTNDFAASIGLPSSLEEAARIAIQGEPHQLDIGQFVPLDIDPEIHSRFFSYIASFGAFTETSYATPQSAKNLLGHIAYLLAGIAELSNLQPHHAKVELDDGVQTEGDYIFAAVANTVSAGGVVKLPASEVSMSDGSLEVLLIRMPRNAVDLNKIVTSLLLCDYKENPMVEFYHTTHAYFTLSESIRWSLDGEEALAGARVHIHCHQRAIQLMKK